MRLTLLWYPFDRNLTFPQDPLGHPLLWHLGSDHSTSWNDQNPRVHRSKWAALINSFHKKAELQEVERMLQLKARCPLHPAPPPISLALLAGTLPKLTLHKVFPILWVDMLFLLYDHLPISHCTSHNSHFIYQLSFSHKLFKGWDLSEWCFLEFLP